MPAGSLFGLIPAKKLDWANNDIDYFIYDKLKQEKLKPSAEADKTVLLRRVSLDLTGVPAPEKWASAFLESHKENAYEELVDSLLLHHNMANAGPPCGWTSPVMQIPRDMKETTAGASGVIAIG